MDSRNVIVKHVAFVRNGLVYIAFQFSDVRSAVVIEMNNIDEFKKTVEIVGLDNLVSKLISEVFRHHEALTWKSENQGYDWILDHQNLNRYGWESLKYLPNFVRRVTESIKEEKYLEKQFCTYDWIQNEIRNPGTTKDYKRNLIADTEWTDVELDDLIVDLLEGLW